MNRLPGPQPKCSSARPQGDAIAGVAIKSVRPGHCSLHAERNRGSLVVAEDNLPEAAEIEPSVVEERVDRLIRVKDDVFERQ